MNRPKRRLILIIGVPDSGKTALALRITDAMIATPGYDSVFVLDVGEQHSVLLNPFIGDLQSQIEYLEEDEARIGRAASSGGLQAGMAARTLDGPLIRNLTEFDEYCRLFAAERKSDKPSLIPPRVIWRCGPRSEDYAPPIAEACNIGNVAIVPCESRRWWPPFKHQWPFMEIPGRDDVTMESLITEGRSHVRNRHGDHCPVHLVLDAQSFGLLHWEVRQNVRTVICGRLEGGEAYSIIRKEFGDGTGELVSRVRKLKMKEWIAVRGEMPELAPYRGGGRR